MRLTDEELRDVLARAEEIEASGRPADAARAEMEAVIAAGEAVGLTRPAIERAVRERFDLDARPPAVGDVWLKPPKRDTGEQRLITKAALIGAGAAIGGAIGSIIALLLR